jgi:hypothetical protein
MAAKSFLRVVAGRITQIMGVQSSAGAANAGDIPALDDTGRLDNSMMPVGIGADTKVLPASEALSAGNVVNVWYDAGTAKARKADATAEGKEATGFVLSGVSSGADATVYFEGSITGLSGLTPGARYYLSAATPGALVDAASLPAASGNVIQYVGTATSATELSFEPSDPITLA